MTTVVGTHTSPKSTLGSWKCKGDLNLRQSVPEQVVDVVENQLRHITKTKMIRVSEFFKDFDPLRSGYITNQQFRRCLDENLALNVPDSDFECLVGKYGQDKDREGMINYRAFEDSMENAFNPHLLNVRPSNQILTFTSTATPFKHSLDEEQLQLTDNILRRCHDYYKRRGITVKSCYGDFDRSHRGFVTENQFHRSFPGPSDITPNEISILANRYWDPATGLHNYINFHDDVISIGTGGTKKRYGPHPPPKEKDPSPSSLESILARIRDVVYKNGIRTTEFFCDRDKLRSGVVTENQFISGLCNCCGHLAHLSREEIQMIIDHYKTEDGRVGYTEFCSLMENAYNEPGLEKKPTTNVYRPLRGHLLRPLNSLESTDEDKLVDILQRLRSEVKTRGLLLYPYFRDFDKGKGYTRGVTKPQFERILHFLSLNISSEEAKLLQSKFEADNGVDMNYTAFIQAIDKEYVGQVMERNKTLDESDSAANRAPPQPLPHERVELLVSRLREHVHENRIRVTEHFQDCDPLRSGSITASRFRQGLSSMGKPNLTNVEFQALCALYPDPKRKGHILWKKFVSQMDDPELASAVSVPIPLPPPPFRPGAVDFANEALDEEQKCLEAVLYRLKGKIQQRRIMAKPVFQDFDRHHVGYVTKTQFRQCLFYLGLEASDQELSIMEMCFTDAKGFNYLQLLKEIDPGEKLVDTYKFRVTEVIEKRKRLANAPLSTDSLTLEMVLNKVKAKVCKERMRIYEFMKDYDKLRCGRVHVTAFSRALDLCGFELSPEEVYVLKNRYLCCTHPDFVDYMSFSDDVESIFTTKGLEKAPTAEIEQFVPPVEIGLHPVSDEEEQIFQDTMHRIAERVRARRIQLFPLFEDFDRVHIGSVTKSQFHRVLSELELAWLVNTYEFGILTSKFEMKVGGRNDVNYIAFCDMCNDYALQLSRPVDPAK